MKRSRRLCGRRCDLWICESTGYEADGVTSDAGLCDGAAYECMGMLRGVWTSVHAAAMGLRGATRVSSDSLRVTREGVERREQRRLRSTVRTLARRGRRYLRYLAENWLIDV